MQTWKCLCWALALELVTGAAWAQSHHHCSPGGGGSPLAAVGGIPSGYWYPYYSTIGAGGVPVTFVPPIPLIATGGFSPALGPLWSRSPFSNGVGAAGPWPPPGQAPRKNAGAGDAGKAKRSDPGRATQLVTFGDRLFRSGNVHRAAERYEQALIADPNSATTRVRLAQVALVRGQYSEAANRFREALTVEPGWLLNAPDIQTIYGEPVDFAKQIARLETHLQANPNDRDAWYVLGAQWYLSGQTRKASDVFLRLTDRKGDATLAAFLDATTPHGLPEQ